jgi:hypothetical protein
VGALFRSVRRIHINHECEKLLDRLLDGSIRDPKNINGPCG